MGKRYTINSEFVFEDGLVTPGRLEIKDSGADDSAKEKIVKWQSFSRMRVVLSLRWWIDDFFCLTCGLKTKCDATRRAYARVIKQAYRIEESFRRAKSECGLAEYQVRNWRGWHHHVALSLLTLWFLTDCCAGGTLSC